MRKIIWTPRVLAMAFIAFVSLFAFDVFDGHHSPAETLVALAVHLIPSFVLIAGLVLAWRRPWVGALTYGVLGVVYILTTVARAQPSLGMRLLWCVTIGGPALLVAALFWVIWRHQRRHQQQHERLAA